uniref:Transmembrane protein 255B n=1 Tax=Acanthochromis polyacanthus TaxID=80966 RepID=A0A3Q1EH45_9TELE
MNEPSVSQYLRRRKTALWISVSLLSLGLVILALGLVAATRTDNVPVAGYYSGITLVASIVFISLGVIASFFCAIMDGIIDIRPLQEDMCDFYSSGSGYLYDSYYTEVILIQLRLRSDTCYCCYLYNCGSPEHHSHYYQFNGVSSCWDVIHLHRLLWASVVLSVVGFFLGIIAAAILGAYKEMVSRRGQDKRQIYLESGSYTKFKESNFKACLNKKNKPVIAHD